MEAEDSPMLCILMQPRSDPGKDLELSTYTHPYFENIESGGVGRKPNDLAPSISALLLKPCQKKQENFWRTPLT